MFQNNKFTQANYTDSAVTSKRSAAQKRQPILYVAAIYLLSVVALVLLAKIVFAGQPDPIALAEQSRVEATDVADKIVAIAFGLAIAIAFFFTSKRQAHKLLG